MRIYGFQKLTMLDYPGHVGCTVFTGGCDFRCPFCHNTPLVRAQGAPMDEREVLDYLGRRTGLLEGVCISGGEPLLQSGIEEFIRSVKGLGYLVKLDTNGSHPEQLMRLAGKGLLDYVAMDVKNSPDKYAATAGVEGLDTAGILRSIEILKSGAVEHEFRTTVVKELHTAEDIRRIAAILGASERYYIQPFRDSGDILSPGMSRHSDEELAELLAAARETIPGAELRG